MRFLLISLLFSAVAGAMLFKSEKYTAQWDTWAFHHEDTFYMYYLITEGTTGEGYGVATSKDGIQWTDHGMQIEQSDENSHYLGTGSVWKSPTFEEDGLFYCNYSEHRKVNGRNQQNILFAKSRDLIRWEKLPADTMFRPDPENGYAEFGRWDCIFTFPREEGGFYGTWTANGSEIKGTVGIGYSEDGISWTTLPAPVIEPGVGESGAMYPIDGKLYAMFGKRNMYSYQADQITGPYTASPKNFEIIMRPHSYFCRYLPTEKYGLLANHHVMSGTRLEQTKFSRRREITYVSPFKRVIVDDEGIMRWKWWEGNDALKGESISTDSEADFNKGIVFEADLTLPEKGKYAEVVFESYGRDYAVRVLHDGQVHFGLLEGERRDFRKVHDVNRENAFPQKSLLRIIARAGMMETYLDGHFMECWTMGCHGATTIKLGSATTGLVKNAQLWQMPLEPALAPLREVHAEIRNAWASSNASMENRSDLVCDDDRGTRWRSRRVKVENGGQRPPALSEWIEYRIDKSAEVGEATLIWGDEHPETIALKVKDGRKWITLYEGPCTGPGVQKLDGLDGIRSVNARLEMTGGATSYSLYEFQLHRKTGTR